MVLEIKAYLQSARVGHETSGEPARIDRKCRMPAVVEPWRACQLILPDDLRPKVQGRTGFSPICVWKWRPVGTFHRSLRLRGAGWQHSGLELELHGRLP